jgi:peptidyl-Lys metalloendopeptidase
MSSATSTTRPAITCRLEAQAPASIRFELSNGSDSTLRVLTWNTPLEGWKGTVLRVTRDGEELPYQGPMLKRGDPQADAYMEIPAGGKVDATVDLAEVYDVSRPGTYKVEADGDLIDVTAGPTEVIPRPRGRHQPQPLDCGVVTFDRRP